MYSRSLYLHLLADARFSPADVRRYYDANTARFVRHGQGGTVGAIHRAVWAPGITDRAEAFRYVENLVIREVDTLGLDRPAHILDLGCGVGTSLIYIGQRRTITGSGITLSPLQARLGVTRVLQHHLASRIRIVEGDYCALPADTGHADLAYAIESFVHGPSPARFFREAARAVSPGGRLVVCDDVRVPTGDAAAARTVEQFRRGWHVNSLITADEMREHAISAGFVPEWTRDLTPWLELGRPRDRAIALLAGLAGWLPRLPRGIAPLVGGAALQRGLARGWIAYHCASFRRT